MTSPLPHSSSDYAQLLMGPLGYQVGWQEPVYLKSPAAGSEWIYTVDGRYSERVLGVTFTLQCSAAVATRFPTLRLTDQSGREIIWNPCGAGTVASNAITPFLVTNSPQYVQGTAGRSAGFLADFIVPPGWSWGSLTFGIDVADQYSGIVLLVQRFPSDVTRVLTDQL